MPKEILLYTGIYDFTAEDVINRLNDAMDDEVDMRVNSGGGSVFAGWGMIAKIKEHGNVNIKNDGIAASMAANLNLYSKSSESLDVTKFILHRADMYVAEGDVEMQKFLDNVNKDLRSRMKMRLNEEKFKEVAGMTIDEMFDSKKQVNVFLNARQAKEIGLIQKITKVNPTEMKAFNEMIYKVAAEYKPTNENSNSNPNIMTLAELKAQHPNIYNEIFALGILAGVSQEKDRVEACLVFNEIDPAGVKAAIESGKPLSAKQMAEFGLKSMSADALKKLASDSTGEVKTGAVTEKDKTEKDKQVNDFADDVKNSLKKSKSPEAIKAGV